MLRARLVGRKNLVGQFARRTRVDPLDRLEADVHQDAAPRLLRLPTSARHGRTFDEWRLIEPPEYYTSTAAATRAAFRR